LGHLYKFQRFLRLGSVTARHLVVFGRATIRLGIGPHSSSFMPCCRVADVDARSRFVAETTEGEAAAYVGVVAVVLIVIPICLIIVTDVITFVNPNTARQHHRLRYGRHRVLL